MSTTTSNQGLILPTSGDGNNVPNSFTQYNNGVEPRLVQRYESATDRGVRNPSPSDGELSYLADVDTFDGRVNGSWQTIFSAAAWTAYTPAWGAVSGTQPTLGNGSLVGRYQQIGKTVHVYMQLTVGSTSTLGSTKWTLALPVPARAGGLKQVLMGRFFEQTEGLGYLAVGDLSDGATARLEVQGLNTYLATLQASNSALRFTAPAAGDYLSLEGTYEAA